MSILCVIAARGGSQGVPGKNIRSLLGRPVITWALETALGAPEIDRVVVSTDSREIADIATAAGADVPFLRPADLAQPDIGKFQVWQHALAACEQTYRSSYELFVDVDCTNPLLESTDVTAAIEQFRTLRTAGVAVDAVFTIATARHNPYFNLVERSATGALKMSKTSGEKVLARQNAPPVYEHVAGVYVMDPAYLRRAQHLLDGHAEGYEVSAEKAVDIDTEVDFALVEVLLKRRMGLRS
jgi:CMP-N,N'-diacetyllegionaminic acid synthase